MHDHDADSPAPTGGHGLVVLANRLPVQRVNDEWRASPGGLVRAMLGVLRSRGGAWIGWSGDISQAETWTDIESASSRLSDQSELDNTEMIAVPLTEAEFVHYLSLIHI